MDFSYGLKIDGVDYYSFSDLKIRESTDGFGTSGVSTAEFTFTLSTEEYESFPINSAAEVKLYMNGSKIAQTFYISSRSKQSDIIKFKCYDRMVYTDQDVFFSESDFQNNTIKSYWLLDKIRSQCGFASYGVVNGNDVFLKDISILREKVEGRSCRELLEILSSAWCGYFKADHDNSLLFIPFGEIYAFIDEVERYTEITEGNSKGPIDQVIMTNGQETFYSGNSNDIFKTLKITSDLATQELAGIIMQRVNGYTYQSWKCSKMMYDNAVTSSIAEITSQFVFSDGSVRIANYIEKVFTSYGIFISCGSNDFTENEFEYIGALSRQIEKRIADGEILGNNTMITRYQGTIHLGATNNNAKSDENSTPKRYGYAPATTNGVVEFEGSMVSKIAPKSATINPDKTEAVINYEDKSYKYKIQRDNNGNITSFEKEEIKENEL